MIDKPPPRRWFRFSLRTMFVVVTILAAVGGWVASRLVWIRARDQLLYGQERWIGNSDVQRFSAGGYAGEQPDAPGMLWLFGDGGVGIISILDGTNEDIQMAKTLFPEAEIEVKRVIYPETDENGSIRPE
jgi:hypothetical protein